MNAKTEVRGVVMRVTAIGILVQLALSSGAPEDNKHHEDNVSDMD